MFQEYVVEGYKDRKKRSRKPDGGCEECARQKREGKARSEYCYQNCGKKGKKLKDSRMDHTKVNRDKGTDGNGDGKDQSRTENGTYVKEKPSTNRARNGKDGRSTLKTEEHGAGDMGTYELLRKYLNDTPYSRIDGYGKLFKLKDKKKHDKDSDCGCE